MEHDDQYWNRQGCIIIIGLTFLIWFILILGSYWVYKWGIAID